MARNKKHNSDHPASIRDPASITNFYPINLTSTLHVHVHCISKENIFQHTVPFPPNHTTGHKCGTFQGFFLLTTLKVDADTVAIAILI